MNYNDSYIDLLIQRCLDRTATAEERKIFLHIIKYMDNENIEAKIVAAFEQEQFRAEPGSTVWATIEQQIATTHPTRRIPVYKRALSLLKYAAVLLLFSTIPIYLFRDVLPPVVSKLKLVRKVSTILEGQSKSDSSKEFAKEIQLVLSPDKTVNLIGRDSFVNISAEKYIRISHSDNQITYSLKDSLAPIVPLSALYHTIKVPYGKHFSVKLIDGTLVSLNSGTELRYPMNRQEQQMDLYLTGEAYFDVAKSKNRKFNVHVQGDENKKEHIIQVLGTQFNIKAFPKDRQSITTLFEGAIQVSGIDKVPVHLRPSQQIAIGNTFAVSDADLEGASAWRHQFFYFKNTPLEEVCMELERWYGVKISYRKGRGSKTLLAQISRKKNLKEVLEMLAQTYAIKYQYYGKEVVLTD